MRTVGLSERNWEQKDDLDVKWRLKFGLCTLIDFMVVLLANLYE